MCKHGLIYPPFLFLALFADLIPMNRLIIKAIGEVTNGTRLVARVSGFFSKAVCVTSSTQRWSILFCVTLEKGTMLSNLSKIWKFCNFKSSVVIRYSVHTSC